MKKILPRREFVKGLLMGTAASTFISKPWSALIASEMTPAASDTGVIQLNIQDYPPLQGNLGSIRLGVNPIVEGPAFIFPDGNFYPVIITRGSAGDLHCVESMCQHAGCVVNVYSSSEGGLPCPCHGSLFGIDGRVLRGPTQSPLVKYEHRLEGNILKIQVPNLRYDVAVSLGSSATPRIRLQFHAHLKVEYEVHFREHLTDQWSRVAFSQTVNGTTNQLVLRGSDAVATVYVERAKRTGFYAAAMRLLNLT